MNQRRRSGALTRILQTLLLLLLISGAVSAQVNVELGELDGTLGSIFLNDSTTNPLFGAMFLGGSMIGDINNDGLADFAQSGAYGAGFVLSLIVVFGSEDPFPSPFSLASLDGANGFVINDSMGNLTLIHDSSSVGDVNGDGIDDLGVAAEGSGSEIAFVVYGRNGAFPATFDTSDLDGSNGFVIEDSSTAGSNSGAFFLGKTPGDFNCDTRDDFLLGSPEAAGAVGNPGAAFVIFGQASDFPATFDLDSLNGGNGFMIGPPADAVDFGVSSSSLGDFNGDTCDDLAVGDLNAPGPDPEGGGQIRVIFGSNAAWPAVFDPALLVGTNGFAVHSAAAPVELGGLGTSVAGGDVNGDGFSDLLSGAPGGTGGAVTLEGGAVIYEGAAVTPAMVVISSLGGGRASHTRGWAGDTSNPGVIGSYVASGDLNDDGFDDLVMASPAETWTPTEPNAGIVYALFGRSGGFEDQIQLTGLAESRGFILTGAQNGDGAGIMIDVGDVNGDGSAEIYVGANSADHPASSLDEVFYVTRSPMIFSDGFESGDLSVWD